MARLGPAFADALAYAAELHADQLRKGTQIPYVSHLLAVCALVLENGGSESEAIAALLHDAAEDRGGEHRLAEISDHFGEEVAEIVRECSDSLVADERLKPPWEERKRAYVEHIRTASSDGAVLVSLADKLHNSRAIARDVERHGVRSVWGRFNRPREAELGYYYALLDAFRARIEPGDRAAQLLAELERAVEALGHPDESL